MFAHLSRGHRRTALVVLSLVSLAGLGACANSATGPDRVLPPDGMHATQQRQVSRAGASVAKELSGPVYEGPCCGTGRF